MIIVQYSFASKESEKRTSTASDIIFQSHLSRSHRLMVNILIYVSISLVQNIAPRLAGTSQYTHYTDNHMQPLRL